MYTIVHGLLMTNTWELTIKSARVAAQRDALPNWVLAYLNSDFIVRYAGNIVPDDEVEGYWWREPVRIPLNDLTWTAGPEDHENWGAWVKDRENTLRSQNSLPPLVADYHYGQLQLLRTNCIAAAMRKMGLRKAWVILRYESYEDFATHNIIHWMT